MHGRLVLGNTILVQEGSDPVPERDRHVGALLEPSGWPIYPDSMCRFQEQSTRVGVMRLDTLGGR
jgi:hypothetical protein